MAAFEIISGIAGSTDIKALFTARNVSIIMWQAIDARGRTCFVDELRGDG